MSSLNPAALSYALASHSSVPVLPASSANTSNSFASVQVHQVESRHHTVVGITQTPSTSPVSGPVPAELIVGWIRTFEKAADLKKIEEIDERIGVTDLKYVRRNVQTWDKSICL